ncbi:hypothetical protein ILUMI_08260 [Ignelater luminosus]|uniref:Peptidase aspartic putative domain-containing protein n=1 Tax=Ignelater luminosus TaxID=2038154 RepID=A0A8K0GAU0_IGNLU|nr:hypothetical protein ILUMI_08260 [Ignelater luminosus]
MALSVLYDKVQSHLRNLCSLGVTVDNCAPILMPLVSSFLPAEILRTWERKGRGAGSSSKVMLESLLEFLKSEIEGDQNIAMALDGFGLTVSHSPRVEQNKGKTNNRDRFKNCKETTQREVPTAAGLLITVKDQPKGDCIFCFSGHRLQECIKAKDMPLAERRKTVEEKKACFCCLRLSHSAKFCRNGPKCIICKKPHFPIVCEGIKEVDKGKPEVPKEGTQLKLSTVIIRIQRPKNPIFLKAQQKEWGIYLKGVSRFSTHCNYTYSFKAIDHHKICENIAPIPSGPWVEKLKLHNIYLSDVNTNGAIAVLLGADVVGSLLTGNRKEVRNGLIAFQTKLGWTLMGKISNDADNCKGLSMLVTNMLTKDAKITDLWSLDRLGITDPSEKLSKVEREAATHQHFLDSVKINEEGRIEVRLPFIENHPPLSTNYGLAMKRMNGTIKKLKIEGYYEAYQLVLNDWINKGIIEDVIEELGDKSCHYLPHQHVIKLGSSTPIRPVFDASARHHINRNSFPYEQIGYCSGYPEDRDYLRFLWETTDGRVIIYRQCRVVFGVSPSPFQLAASIEYHLGQGLAECKSSVQDSYHLDTQTDCLEFMELAKSVMWERKFDLRGWEFNTNDEVPPSNVLGLLWNRKADTLEINIGNLSSIKLGTRTWKQGTTGDQEVDPEISARFMTWMEEIRLLSEVKISRWLPGCTESKVNWTWVREIRELTCGQEWCHVPGTMNPADLVSRGSYPKKFLSTRWWERPSWQQEEFDGVFDKRLKTVLPFTDKDGLIRIKTKVSNRVDVNDFCYPIVLPNHEHPAVFRLILDWHRDNSHAGVQMMTSILCKRHNVKRVYSLELELKFDEVSKGAAERRRKSVEENVTLNSCPGTSDPDEDEERSVKSIEFHETGHEACEAPTLRNEIVELPEINNDQLIQEVLCSQLDFEPEIQLYVDHDLTTIDISQYVDNNEITATNRDNGTNLGLDEKRSSSASDDPERNANLKVIERTGSSLETEKDVKEDTDTGLKLKTKDEDNNPVEE